MTLPLHVWNRVRTHTNPTTQARRASGKDGHAADDIDPRPPLDEAKLVSLSKRLQEFFGLDRPTAERRARILRGASSREVWCEVLAEIPHRAD